MTLEIKIDKVKGNAGITIKTAEGIEVLWTDLADEDQAVVINTLYGFTQLFQKAYINAHMPVQEEKASDEVAEVDEPDAEVSNEE